MSTQLPIFFLSLLIATTTSSSLEPACKTRCGQLDLNYPFGSGPGCGSPRFQPYITCTAGVLRLNSHKGSYHITAISYSTSTLTLMPPCMSNCTSMQRSTGDFGLDWPSPFQLGPSTFILLGCSTDSIEVDKYNPVCDPSSSTYLCASINTCPAVVDLGLPLFPAANTCCVYSPADLGPKDELDLRKTNCQGYSSVIGLGDVPADPRQWVYGVLVRYTLGGLDGYNIAPGCRGCETSGGACGYAPPDDSFVCVCEYGNTTTDCFGNSWIFARSCLTSKGTWLEIIAVLVLMFMI